MTTPVTLPSLDEIGEMMQERSGWATRWFESLPWPHFPDNERPGRLPLLDADETVGYARWLQRRRDNGGVRQACRYDRLLRDPHLLAVMDTLGEA